jgi:hypothetical protein
MMEGQTSQEQQMQATYSTLTVVVLGRRKGVWRDVTRTVGLIDFAVKDSEGL